MYLMGKGVAASNFLWAPSLQVASECGVCNAALVIYDNTFNILSKGTF